LLGLLQAGLDEAQDEKEVGGGGRRSEVPQVAGILAVFLLPGAKGSRGLHRVFVLFHSSDQLLLTTVGKGRDQRVEAAWLPADPLPRNDPEVERLEHYPEWIISIVNGYMKRKLELVDTGSGIRHPINVVPLRCARAGLGR